MLLTNREYYQYENEVWVRTADGDCYQLTMGHTDEIEALLEVVATFYPKAYAALHEEYKGCAMNKPYYRYRMAARFIRCNFGAMDNTPDVKSDGTFSFEYIQCPLRGECKNERVICRPTFDHKISPAEMPVVKMWYDGYSEDEIADRLCLSPHTVHNHIRNTYTRLAVHNRAELVKYAIAHNLFNQSNNE